MQAGAKRFFWLDSSLWLGRFCGEPVCCSLLVMMRIFFLSQDLALCWMKPAKSMPGFLIYSAFLRLLNFFLTAPELQAAKLRSEEAIHRSFCRSYKRTFTYAPTTSNSISLPQNSNATFNSSHIKFICQQFYFWRAKWPSKGCVQGVFYMDGARFTLRW